MKVTSEAAFETALTETFLANGYEAVAADNFDRENAIFPGVALDFIRKTQPQAWVKLEALHGAKTNERVLHDLCKWMDTFTLLALSMGSTVPEQMQHGRR